MGTKLIANSLMNINALQHTLEDIYAINTAYRVEQFIFTDPQLARQLDNTPLAREIPEKLLVYQHPDGLDISLYLDSQLLEKLQQSNPLEKLAVENLNEFCHVIEGISHFIYLVWNASQGRQVTQLELEIQAEIDKYITCAALFARQCDGEIPPQLHRHLFDEVQFDRQLHGVELQRYILANEYAKRYCRLIHEYLLRLRSGVLITREIRRFYRLLHRQKIAHINELKRLH